MSTLLGVLIILGGLAVGLVLLFAVSLGATLLAWGFALIGQSIWAWWQGSR